MKTKMDIAKRLRLASKLFSPEEHEAADEIEKLRTLIADLKEWDVEQYMTIPHHLRARMQAVLTPK